MIDQLQNDIDERYNVAKFYEKMALDNAFRLSELWFGKTIGYRKKRITKYLYIPVPFIQKHYDYDCDEFEGLLFNVRWIKTPIPIGKETIEVPIMRKMKGQKIKFRRITPLDLL